MRIIIFIKSKQLLKTAAAFIVLGLANLSATACNVAEAKLDLPPDRLEAYNKAQAIINKDKPTKGSQSYYQALFDNSKYVYVGRVKLILKKSDRADEADKDDSIYAYVKISKGWKTGKVRDIRLKIPKQELLCDSRYQYRLKEKRKYLFFENRKGLITALPLNNKTSSDRFAAEAITLYGESDWYYSRNTTLHYNSKK